MQTVTLFASSSRTMSLHAFAKVFFDAIGIHRYEERLSANYVGEVYVLAEDNGLRFVAALADEKELLEFPFWIQITGVPNPEERLYHVIDKSASEKLRHAGLHIIKVLEFGKKTQFYSDI